VAYDILLTSEFRTEETRTVETREEALEIIGEFLYDVDTGHYSLVVECADD